MGEYIAEELSLHDQLNPQTILFDNKGEVQNENINKRNLKVISSSRYQSALSSSAVAVKSITDYPFKLPEGHGNGLVVHRSLTYMAYTLQRTNVVGKDNHDWIRVINIQNNQRHLIKELNGNVMDMAFAWLDDIILLACIDTSGVFYVFQITSEPTFSVRLVVEVKDCVTSSSSVAELTGSLTEECRPMRVFWCPYVPENNEELEQLSSLEGPYFLVVTVGNLVEVWHIQQLLETPGVRLRRGTFEKHGALLNAFSFSSNVVAAVISPDSSCIAIASMDGVVRFYRELYPDDPEAVPEGCEEWTKSETSKVPALMFEWLPSEVDPISSLMFPDNVAATTADSVNMKEVWRHCITGHNNNTVFRVWCCKTWQLMQVISFEFPPSNAIQEVTSAPPSGRQSPSLRGSSLSPSVATTVSPDEEGMRVYLDNSGSYLLLSNAARKVLYIVVLSIPSIDDTKGKNEPVDNTFQICVSISEIPIQFVPMCIALISVKKKPEESDTAESGKLGSLMSFLPDGTETNDSFILRCTALTIKSLLHCYINFSPSLASNGSLSSGPENKAIESSINNTVTEVPSNAGEQSGLNLSLNELHDGLSDLSMSFDSKPATQFITLDVPTTSLTCSLASEVPSSAKQVVLSELLPPNHFATPLSSHSTKVVSTNPTELFTGNNTANAKLSALLRCSDPSQYHTVLEQVEALEAQSRTNNKHEQTLPNVSPLSGLLGIMSRDQSSHSSKSSKDGCLRSASVPLQTSSVMSASAIANSATSSPSLEIQQILLQLSDDQSSSSSRCVSEVSSRGPTQLEVAEEDTHVADSASVLQLQQQVKGGTEQPEALRQLSNGGQPVTGSELLVSPPLLSEHVQHGSVSHESALVGTVSMSSSVTGLLRHDSPHASASGVPDQALPVSSPVAIVPSCPAVLSPDTSNFLQALLPRMNADGVSRTSESIQFAPSIGEILSSAKSYSQLTCEELEAKIKSSTDDDISSTSPDHIATTSNDFQFVEPVPENSLIPPVHVHLNSDHKMFAISNSVTLADLINIEPTTVNSYNAEPEQACVSLRGIAEQNGSMPSRTPESSLQSNFRTVPCPVTAAAELGISCTSSTATNTDFVESFSVGIQHDSAPCSNFSIGVQVSAPPPSPPVAVCQHPPAVKYDAELKELRTLLLSYQRTLGQLTNRFDEMSQLRHQLTPEAVAASLRPGVESAARNEIKQLLPQSLARTFDNCTKQFVSQELARLNSFSENKIADNVSRVIHSRQFMDQLTQSICNSITPAVTNACKEACNKYVLPGLNTFTSRVLQQFNELFHKGTTEYLMQVKSEVSGLVACVDSSTSAVVQEMDNSRSALATNTKAQQDLVPQLQQLLAQQTSSPLNEATVRRIVSEEVARLLTAMQRAAPPGTPVPFAGGLSAEHHKPPSPKQAQLQLEQLIAAKQFNSAFRQALSASDLTQVLFVCERVNRESLLTPGNCKLSQEVLLSLVSQLSHDLSQKTDLKMKFLEDALLCIDNAHPLTREHIRNVSTSLQRNLQQHIESGIQPQATQSRFRMMLLAAKQLGNQSPSAGQQ